MFKRLICLVNLILTAVLLYTGTLHAGTIYGMGKMETIMNPDYTLTTKCDFSTSDFCEAIVEVETSEPGGQK